MSVENQNVNKSGNNIVEKGKRHIDWQEFWKSEGLASPKRKEVFPNGEDKGLSDEEIREHLDNYFDKKGLTRFSITGIDAEEFPEIIDEDIRDLCLNLNKLPFLKTKEGCGGHEMKRDSDGKMKPWDSGYSDLYLNFYADSTNPEFQKWIESVGEKLEEFKKSQLTGIENVEISKRQQPPRSSETINLYQGKMVISPTREWCEKNNYRYIKRPSDDEIGFYDESSGEPREEWEKRRKKFQEEEKLFDKNYGDYFRSEEAKKLRDEFFKVFGSAAKEYLNPKKEAVSFENKWNAIAQEIEKTADARGYGIDKNIKDIVLDLNTHGINTIASCEGHAEKNNYSAPWVEIAAPGEPEERFNSQNEAFKKSSGKI